MAPEMISSLEEMGIYAGKHGARQVSKTLVEEADLVLTMNERHIVRTKELLGDLPEYIHVLPEYATGTPGSSIADPYGYTMPAYRAVIRQLLECVEIVLKRLED